MMVYKEYVTLYLKLIPDDCGWLAMVYQFLVLNVYFLFLSSFLLILTKYGALYAPIGYMSFKIIRERVHWCRQIISVCSDHIQPRIIQRFRINQVQSLLFLMRCNRVYGLLLVAFLVGHVPFSGTMFTYVLTRMDHDEFRLLTMIMVCGQYTMIICFHYSAAILSKTMHSIYKPFMSVLVRHSVGSEQHGPSVQHVRFQLCTAWHVQAFHVKRRYGITYASFGLVSLSAFAKVRQTVVSIQIILQFFVQFLFVYSKFMMNNYKKMHQKQQL